MASAGSSGSPHIDGIIPAVYARLPKVHSDESRTQGLDRLELIRFLQVAQTVTVHHGALAYLLGINALRASEAAAVRIEDYGETLRGHRVLHPVGKGDKPATMPRTLILRPMSGAPIDRRDVYRMVLRVAKEAGIPRHISPHSLRHAAISLHPARLARPVGALQLDLERQPSRFAVDEHLDLLVDAVVIARRPYHEP